MSFSIGSSCPAFDLPGTDGQRHALASFGKADLLVVIVSCNHCPYVVAYEPRIAELSRAYAPRGVQIVAINANDTSRYPDDGMAQMTARAKERGFDFPYLRDDSQASAGWEVLLRIDGEIVLGHRSHTEDIARYFANVFRQDHVRTGWAEISPKLEHRSVDARSTFTCPSCHREVDAPREEPWRGEDREAAGAQSLGGVLVGHREGERHGESSSP